MGRLIDEEDVLKLIRTAAMPEDISMLMLYQGVKQLPSAQPERKKGRWVECDTTEHWKCNQCSDRAPMYWDGENMSYAEWLSDFCPNCGADMRGEE